MTLAEIEHMNRGKLKRRLEDLGWRSLTHPGTFMDHSGRIFYVPQHLETDMDYAALQAVINALVEIEGVQTSLELVDRIEGKKEDLLFFAAEILGSASGRIPVKFGGRFYELSARFLKSIADAVWSKRSSFDKKRPAAFFEKLEYGHTSEGSYKVTIHVPVDTYPEPVGRQFVRQSVASFESLDTAIRRESDAPIVSEKNRIWTAPMCESLILFADQRQFSELKIQAAPDPVWREGEPISREQIVVPLQTGAARSVLSSAAAKLRKLKESQDVEIVGIPYASRDDTVINEGDSRAISILWRRPNESPMKVQALLTRDGYAQALKAMTEKREIAIKGWLIQKGHRWVLEAVATPVLLGFFEAIPEIEDENEMLTTDAQAG